MTPEVWMALLAGTVLAAAAALAAIRAETVEERKSADLAKMLRERQQKESQRCASG